MLILWSLLLIVLFYLLARISDRYFLGSLEKISERYDLSSDMAGATLMAIGSSAPELFVSLAAVFRPGDHAVVGVGTIVGSALFNILVIVGVSASVKKAFVSWQPIVRDAVFYAISILLLLCFFVDGKITLNESLIMLGTYVLYVFAIVYWRRFFPYEDDATDFVEDGFDEKEHFWTKMDFKVDCLIAYIFPKRTKYYSVFWVSVFYFGGISWLLVESAIEIAHILQVPEVIIALTVLAIGTSVPDLVSSYLVAKKGKGGMAISNAVGSNTFDILVGLGLPFVVVLAFSDNGIHVSTEGLYVSTLLLLATIPAMIFILFIRNWEMDFYTGYFLIGLYIIYFIWSVSRVLV